MPPPVAEGGRLSGEDMANYFASFASKFLEGKIQFSVEVSNIRRGVDGKGWLLDVFNLDTHAAETRTYARLVLCTGVSRALAIARVALTSRTRAAVVLTYLMHSALRQ